MTAAAMTVGGVRIPAPLAALLNDPCMCARSLQEPERVTVGQLSLLVCLVCGKLATTVRK